MHFPQKKKVDVMHLQSFSVSPTAAASGKTTLYIWCVTVYVLQFSEWTAARERVREERDCMGKCVNFFL
jgi:hypothetical protein